jgi:hypothetical protein
MTWNTDRDRRHRTPRAGPLNHADDDIPMSGLHRMPPPIPPKDAELHYWPVMDELESPARVTPWLLRRVKTPVSLAPRMTRPVPADVRVSPDSEPPSYQMVQESYPGVEWSGRVPESGNAANASRGGVSSAAVHVPRHTPTKPARHDKRDTTEAQRSAISCPSQSSLRSSHRDRSRPRTPAHRVATPEPVPPPNHHRSNPFRAPPPYHASEGAVPLNQSRPPHRIHKKSSASEKQALPLALPCHPPLPNSAESRIRAAYNISKEFGDAVMRQELRVAIPMGSTEWDPTPTPRSTQRFMSVTEGEGLHKAKEYVDRGAREHEARRRALSKPSGYVGHGYSESHQRTIGAVKAGRVNHDSKCRNTSGQRR